MTNSTLLLSGATVSDRFLELVPTALFFFLAIIIGFVLSIFLGRLCKWAVATSGVEALFERVGGARFLYAVGYKHGSAQLAGTLGKAVGLVLTALVAAEIAGLRSVATALSDVVGFVPQLLLAIAIFIACVWLADMVRAVVLRIGKNRKELQSPKFVAELAYYCVVGIGITLGADQLGVETALINNLILILIGCAAAGIALSLALGARGVLTNVVSRHYAGRLFKAGDLVELADDKLDGVVVGYGPTSVILRQGKRELIVPCGRLMQQPTYVERVVPQPVEPISEPTVEAPA